MKNLVKVAVVAAGLFLTANTVNAQQKFAHINSAELLQSMPDIKAADATFQTFQKQKQALLEKMDAERQTKMTAAQELYKTLSEANKEAVTKQLQTMQNDIAELEKRMTETQEKAQQEMKAKQDELYNPILEKAGNAVKAVAKEKGYAYVFDTAQPTLVYFDGGDDLLPVVKAKLGISATAAPAASKPAGTTPVKK